MRSTVLGLLVCATLSCGAKAAELDLKAELRAVRGNPNVVIDLNRPLIIGELIKQWNKDLSSTGLDAESATELMMKASAPQLRDAINAGSFAEVLAALSKPALRTNEKTLGDATRDVTYTPVTPCRLIDTRGAFSSVYQGGGQFAPGEIRTYSAVGGNGVCLTQLPAGLGASALQLVVYGISTQGGSGDIEILPQGSTFGSTATMVFIGATVFTTVSATTGLNLATNQFGIQVRGSPVHITIDVVGYFKPPTLTPVSSLVRSGNFILFSGQALSQGTLGCPAGQYTISGSCSASSYNTILSGSYLNVSNGWTCDYNNQSFLAQSVTVTAICVEIPARPLY